MFPSAAAANFPKSSSTAPASTTLASYRNTVCSSKKDYAVLLNYEESMNGLVNRDHF